MKFKDHMTARPQDYETTKQSRGRVVTWSRGHAFTLVEMLVTLVLLSLIVLALMAVFNSTQKAFRASLTQTDILESGRLTMGLITSDLEAMAPSNGNVTNLNPLTGIPLGIVPVNFYANTNLHYVPLLQGFPGSSQQRTNVLENFFILSRQNINGTPSWVGTGYVVNHASQPTNSLYRFYMSTNVADGNPGVLFYTFATNILFSYIIPGFNPYTNTTYWSHLMDGVVDLTVTPYDPNGFAMTNTPQTNSFNGQIVINYYLNTYFMTPSSGVAGFYMFSNTVPASVQVEMGVLEDATLQHVEGLPDAVAQMNYLSNHVGQVHLFRQRVWIRNVDPAAYQ